MEILESYNLWYSMVYKNNLKSYYAPSIRSKIYPLLINDSFPPIKRMDVFFELIKFSRYPEIQYEILKNQENFDDLKTNLDNDLVREDFEEIKVELMYWIMKLKLLHHPISIGTFLDDHLRSKKPIVELNAKDEYWGTKNNGSKWILDGMNVRGKLWMRLAEHYKKNDYDVLLKLDPLNIPEFKILGKQIPSIYNPYYFILLKRYERYGENIGPLKKSEMKEVVKRKKVKRF
jgi:hypothetical protein